MYSRDRTISVFWCTFSKVLSVVTYVYIYRYTHTNIQANLKRAAASSFRMLTKYIIIIIII